MLITEFFLSIVLCLIQWRLARAHTIICMTGAFCQEAGPCEGDDINSCFLDSGAMHTLRVNYDDGDGNDILTSCYSYFSYQHVRCPGPETSSNILMKDLTLNYVSINPKYFKLTVSWSLTESSGHRGGYELRFTNIYDRISLCYCLGNSNKTKVTIRNLRYDRLNHFKSVQVLSYPRHTEYGLNVSQLLRQDIQGCADVQHNGTLCGNRLYPKPRNLTVESSWCGADTKSMKITWDPPSVDSDVPLPKIYYIYLYSQPYNYVYTHHFTVRGTNEVELMHLIQTRNYKVYVQPYRKCLGLGNAVENLGCGKPAVQIERRVGDCQSINK